MVITLIILSITTVATLFFVILLFQSSRYEQYIEPLDGRSFPLKNLYGIGFNILQILNFKYSGKESVKLRREIVILYGDKYGDYYLRVFYAQRIALSYGVFVIMSVISCLSGADSILIMFGLGIILAATVFYYYMQQSSETIKKLSQKYISTFPSVVSTMALLVNAGMVLRDAWDIVAFSDDTEMHRHMQKVTDDRNNGMSEADALSAMARRCATPEISKFVSMVIQGLSKGNSDLAFALKDQSDELWELKQQKLLQEGEKASGKLIIPIMIMFVGILIMIMLPIMNSI